MLAILHAIFVEPLSQIYGALLDIPPAALGMGGRIVFFSIALNLLLAPLYYEMDRRSRRTRALKDRVAEDVARMQRHYKGRERYFYIRTVYRQHGYHPISFLAGSADLFVQVVVFFTVYHYLAGLQSLVGESFGPLTDLSKPDHLLLGINVMPFVMTAINVASVFAYVGDRARRAQALALAALFLVLLYNSPAGLVLYWTTNNLFSLARNYLQRWLAHHPVGKLRQQAALLQQQS
jgi:membrane protein insertase Oxa1/YidC/SpoIIIJ